MLGSQYRGMCCGNVGCGEEKSYSHTCSVFLKLLLSSKTGEKCMIPVAYSVINMHTAIDTAKSGLQGSLYHLSFKGSFCSLVWVRFVKACFFLAYCVLRAMALFPVFPPISYKESSLGDERATIFDDSQTKSRN